MGSAGDDVTTTSDHTVAGPQTAGDAPNRRGERLVLGAVVLVAVLIGANFSVIKEGLEYTTPFLMASMRTVIGGTFLLVVATLRGERLPTDRRDLRNIFVVGLSITTVSSGLLVFGISRTPAGVSSLIGSTMPLFTAVLSLVLLSARVSRLGMLGLVIGFGGTAVLAAPSIAGDTGLTGIVALVFSALAWAFGTVYMKWRDFGRVSPIMLVGVQLIMSAMMLVPFALIVEGTADTSWGWGLFVPLL
ncbi:MAG: EamA family transporter, partial [Actinomycetota bacterium]